jgi:hypothetical protein
MDTLHQFPKRIYIQFIGKQAGEETNYYLFQSCFMGVKLILHSEGIVDVEEKWMKRRDIRIQLQKAAPPLRIFIVWIIYLILESIDQGLR